MRELCTAPDAQQASILVDYLLTQKIPAEIRLEEGQQVIWVKNEDDVDQAKAIWAEFQQCPHDSKYVASRKPAKVIRKQHEQANKKYEALYADAYDFWGRPAPGRVPLTMGLIILSVAVSVLTQLGHNYPMSLHFTMTDRPIPLANDESLRAASDPDKMIYSIQTECWRRGEVWRFVTPIFLHFGPIHLVFNIYALFSLGGLVEFRKGRWWTLIFVLVAALASNFAEFYFPWVFEFRPDFRNSIGAHLFGGMSGVNYAFFGYLLGKTYFGREPGLKIPQDVIYMMLFWLVLCMTGWIGGIANTAHVAGLGVGLVVSQGPWAWRRYVAKS